MILYRFLVSLAALPVLALLVWRALRGRDGWRALAERLGEGSSTPHGGWWLHAASNGELASVRSLIDALLAVRPGLHILVTTNTVTGRTLARGWGLPQVTARLAPLDHRFVLARFFARHQPDALILIENELWPNRLAMAETRRIPVAVLGARISGRSARRWRKTGLGPRLLSRLSALSAQSVESEQRFVGLGLPHDRILPRLNLKTAVVSQTAHPLEWPRADTVLAASTHGGEEEQVLAAFLQARRQRPELRLILAPRHPRRSARIAALIHKTGLSHSTRSAGEPPSTEVYLADTMGEMANWYASAGICFIGGTLVAKGGHTPYEPAAHGCALLHGPDIANFREGFDRLDAAGGARIVTDSRALSDALITLDGPAQSAMAQAAKSALGNAADLAAMAAMLEQKMADAHFVQ